MPRSFDNGITNIPCGGAETTTQAHRYGDDRIIHQSASLPMAWRSPSLCSAPANRSPTCAPTYASRQPTMKVVQQYAAQSMALPSCSIVNSSRARVDMVDNPPHMPMPHPRFTYSFARPTILRVPPSHAESAAYTKQAAIFAANVPIWNAPQSGMTEQA